MWFHYNFVVDLEIGFAFWMIFWDSAALYEVILHFVYRYRKDLALFNPLPKCHTALCNTHGISAQQVRLVLQSKCDQKFYVLGG